MTTRTNRRFTEAVEGYCGGEVLRIETVADPQVPHVFAVRATVKVGPHNPFDLFFLARDTSEDIADMVDELEEVEFTEWPPVARQ